MLKRTPLFSAHQNLGARLIDFGEWEMPVQYTGIVDEHLAVRRAAGIFDISHMGQLCISGENACGFLNRVLTNDARRLGIGEGQYTLMCNARGGVVDDLYVYRVMDHEYLLILNASRVEADLDWLERQRQSDPGSARLSDLSATHGALAVQGPVAAEIICRCFPDDAPEGQLAALHKNKIISVAFKGAPFRIARTGYTGEDGFELFGPATHLEALWNQLLEAGRAQGLKPCGLGARDTLRTEMCYPLYGHELDETTTPLEAGLGKFVALEKEDFVGREPLLQQKQVGVSKKCVALVMTDASPPPRPGYAIWSAECTEPIGRMVSGTQSPSLGKGIGLGYVPPNHSRPGTVLGIEIRGKRYAANVVAKPIYRRQVGPSANAV